MSLKPSNARKRRAAPSAETSSSASDGDITDRSEEADQEDDVEVSNRSSGSKERSRLHGKINRHIDVETSKDRDSSRSQKDSSKATKRSNADSRSISGSVQRSKPEISNDTTRYSKTSSPRDKPRDSKVSRTSQARDVGSGSRSSRLPVRDTDDVRQSGKSKQSKQYQNASTLSMKRDNDASQDSDESDVVNVGPSISFTSQSDRNKRRHSNKSSSKPSASSKRTSLAKAQPLFRSDDDDDDDLPSIGRTSRVAHTATQSSHRAPVDSSAAVRKKSDHTITLDIPDTDSSEDDQPPTQQFQATKPLDIRYAAKERKQIEDSVASGAKRSNEVSKQKAVARRSVSSGKRVDQTRRSDVIVSAARADRPEVGKAVKSGAKRDSRDKERERPPASRPATRPLLQPESRSPAFHSHDDSDPGISSDDSVTISIAPPSKLPEPEPIPSAFVKPPLSRPLDAVQSQTNLAIQSESPSKRAIGGASAGSAARDRLSDLLPQHPSNAEALLRPATAIRVNEDLIIQHATTSPRGIMLEQQTVHPEQPSNKIVKASAASIAIAHDRQQRWLRESEQQQVQLANETAQIATYRQNLAVEKNLLSKAREQMTLAQQEFNQIRRELAETQEQLNASYNEVRREAREQQRRKSQLLDREQAAAADHEAAQRLLDAERATLAAEKERFRRQMQKEQDALLKRQAELEKEFREYRRRDSGQDSGIALQHPDRSGTSTHPLVKAKPSIDARAAESRTPRREDAGADSKLNGASLGKNSTKHLEATTSRARAGRRSAARQRIRPTDAGESEGPHVISRHPEPTTSEDEERTRQEEEAEAADFEEALKRYDADSSKERAHVSTNKQSTSISRQVSDDAYSRRPSGRNSLTHPDELSDNELEPPDEVSDGRKVQQTGPSSTLKRLSRSSQDPGSAHNFQLESKAANVAQPSDDGIADQSPRDAPEGTLVSDDVAAFPAMADESEASDRDGDGSRRQNSTTQRNKQASGRRIKNARGARKSAAASQNARKWVSSSASPSAVSHTNGRTGNGSPQRDESAAMAEDGHVEGVRQKSARHTPPNVRMNRVPDAEDTSVDASLHTRDLGHDLGHGSTHQSDGNTFQPGDHLYSDPVDRNTSASTDDIPVPDIGETLRTVIDEMDVEDGKSGTSRKRGRPRKDASTASKTSSRSSQRMLQLNTGDISLTAQARSSLSPGKDERRTQSKSGSPDKQLKPSVHAGRRRESKYQPQRKPRKSLADRASDSSAEDEVIVAKSSTIGQPPPRASQAQIDFRQAEAKKLAEKAHERVNSNRKHYGRSESSERSIPGPTQEHRPGAELLHESAPSSHETPIQDLQVAAPLDEPNVEAEPSSIAPVIVRRQWGRGNATLSAKRISEAETADASQDIGNNDPMRTEHPAVLNADEGDVAADPGEEDDQNALATDDEMSNAEAAFQEIVSAFDARDGAAAGAHDAEVRDAVEDVLAEMADADNSASGHLLNVANDVVATVAAAVDADSAVAVTVLRDSKVGSVSSLEPSLHSNDSSHEAEDAVMQDREADKAATAETSTAASTHAEDPDDLSMSVAKPVLPTTGETETLRKTHTVKLGNHSVELKSFGLSNNGTRAAHDTDSNVVEAASVSAEASPNVEEAVLSKPEVESARGVHEESIELEDAVQAAEKAAALDKGRQQPSPGPAANIDSDEGVHDAEGEDDDTSQGPDEAMSEVAQPNDPFDRKRLLEWANSLTDDVDRSVIGESGVVKLFEEQLDLGLTGLPPLLLAWRLDATDRGRFDKHDYIQLLEDNEIDTPSKLSAWLNKLQDSTLAIQQHKRFLSEASDGAQQEVLSFRVPDEYKLFYRFCFGALREADSDHMPTTTAAKLWDVVLAPFFETGRDLLQFVETAGEDQGKISRRVWNSLLDFCQQVTIVQGSDRALSGHDKEGRVWPGIIHEYVQWVSNGRPGIQSELSDVASDTMDAEA